MSNPYQNRIKKRVDSLLHDLETIETSARSNKVSSDEVAADLAPVMAKLEAMSGRQGGDTYRDGLRNPPASAPSTTRTGLSAAQAVIQDALTLPLIERLRLLDLTAESIKQDVMEGRAQ
ncbi:MAG: hypothetical protein AAGE80_05480 [Pseudomonadota bacterium]